MATALLLMVQPCDMPLKQDLPICVNTLSLTDLM